MVDKKDGDGNDKNNVIPFPTKSTPEQDPRMIGLIVREVLDDLVGQLSPEQRKEFESFLYEEKPDLANKLFSQGDFDDSELELVGEFSVAELDEHIQKCEDYLDLSFEYIKNIERMMFRLNAEMKMEEMREDLQKLWFKVQKKVDFKE